MEMDWDAILLEPIRVFVDQLVGFLPNLLAVLAILIVGWIVAKLIKTGLVRLLGAVKADGVAERIQLAEMLARGGIERTFSQLVGALAYWIVMLVVLVAALNARACQIFCVNGPRTHTGTRPSNTIDRWFRAAVQS